MDPDTISVEELTLDEKIHVLIGDLPEPLQNFIRCSKQDLVISEISQKYQLHADMAGKFEIAFLYMLLGLFSPEDFANSLREDGFDADTIRGLTNDVNEMVFKKLRREELRGGAPMPEIKQTVIPVMKVGSSENNTTTTSLGVEIRPQVQTVTPAHSLTPATPVGAPGAVPAPTPVHPRTMQQDMQLVQQGNLHDAELGVPLNAPVTPAASTYVATPIATVAPTPAVAPPQYAARPQTVASTPYTPPVPPPAWHASAAASFQTASIPNTAPSQLNMPRNEMPLQNQVPPQTPQPSSRPTPSPEPRPAFAPIKKEYGADPYREVPQ